MAHKHSVYDTDAHFQIDGVTRAVKNASSTKTMLIQHDHNSERFTFELPRMIDGHDMSTCNVVQVHYINIDSTDKSKQNSGVYEIDDLQVSPDGEDVVICSWLISANATQYVGNLSFVLRFVCTSSGEVDYAWNTAVNSSVFVAKGIFNGGIVVDEYADVLEQWRKTLFGGVSPEGGAGDSGTAGSGTSGMLVNFSIAEGAESGDFIHLTADKTVAEMQAAWDAGVLLRGNIAGELMVSAKMASGGMFIFEGDILMDGVYAIVIVQGDDQIISYSSRYTMTGATASASGVQGWVPTPKAGDQDKVLSGAGTWVELPSGAGDSNFELIATLDFGAEEMQENYKTVSYTLDNATELVLVGSALTCNNASAQSRVGTTINGTVLNAGSSLVVGKQNTVIYSYCIYKYLPDVGLFTLRTPGATSATNYVGTNALVPYNIIPLTTPIATLSLGQVSGYLTTSGTVKIYARR